jgi:uncharacterized protein YgiM (DUF1202 family)
MTIRKSFASAMLAATLVIATAGAALAAPAWINQHTHVKHKPAHISQNVNWAQAGQQVNVIDAYKSWYKIQLPGKNGWVKKSTVDFKKWGKGPKWGMGKNYSQLEFCFGGQNASFCISH